jgi:endo-alpha-1,4-polygalactosaminidase (GH114 family)
MDLDQEYDDWLAEKRVRYWHRWWLRVVRRQLNQSTKVPAEELQAVLLAKEEEDRELDGD